MAFPLLLPALSLANGILKVPTILEFANMAMGVVAAGIDVATNLQALNAKVQRFVDEGRDPTLEEWTEMQAESDAAHQIIQEEARRRQELPPAS